MVRPQQYLFICNYVCLNECIYVLVNIIIKFVVYWQNLNRLFSIHCVPTLSLLLVTWRFNYEQFAELFVVLAGKFSKLIIPYCCCLERYYIEITIYFYRLKFGCYNITQKCCWKKHENKSSQITFSFPLLQYTANNWKARRVLMYICLGAFSLISPLRFLHVFKLLDTLVSISVCLYTVCNYGSYSLWSNFCIIKGVQEGKCRKARMCERLLNTLQSISKSYMLLRILVVTI